MGGQTTQVAADVIDYLQTQDTHSGLVEFPLVTIAYAQSLDGSIALRRGEPVTLSNEASLEITHHLRAWHDGIMVGIGTVLSDNPRLTARGVDGDQPCPIVVDTHLVLPAQAHLLEHPKPPIVFCGMHVAQDKRRLLEKRGCRIIPVAEDASGKLDLKHAMRELKEMGIHRVMVEGGTRLVYSLMNLGIADVLVLTMAMCFVGGLKILETPLADSRHFRVEGSAWVKGDLWLWGRLQ